MPVQSAPSRGYGRTGPVRSLCRSGRGTLGRGDPHRPLADSRLVARKLADMRMVICAAPAYLARRGVRAPPPILPCTIAWASRCPSRVGANGGCAMRRSACRCRARSRRQREALSKPPPPARAVYGPRFNRRRCPGCGAADRVALDQPLMNLGAAFAVTHPARRPALKIRAFVDFLVETVPERAPRVVRAAR